MVSVTWEEEPRTKEHNTYMISALHCQPLCLTTSATTHTYTLDADSARLSVIVMFWTCVRRMEFRVVDVSVGICIDMSPAEWPSEQSKTA